MPEPKLNLAEGLRQSGLTLTELWARYIAIGGNNDLDDIRRHLTATDCPDTHDHNILAQALNDTYIENGQDHPVAYRHLNPGTTWTPPE